MTKQKIYISHLHKNSYPLLSTLLKHLWQRLQPRLLGYDATSLAHLYLGRFSHSSLSGWMESYFQVSQMFDQVQGLPLAGPLKDIETCPEATSALS